ncbi:MAG: hypothetical protein ABH811_02025 [archaeon]
MNKQLKKIILTAMIMTIGLLLLKFIPMEFFGSEILFDASMHFVIVSFCLYILYFFIEKNKTWRIPYFIFAAAVLIVVSIHRIISNKHNDLGLLLGLIISIIAILIPRWNKLKKRFKF